MQEPMDQTRNLFNNSYLGIQYDIQGNRMQGNVNYRPTFVAEVNPSYTLPKQVPVIQRQSHQAPVKQETLLNDIVMKVKSEDKIYQPSTQSIISTPKPVESQFFTAQHISVNPSQHNYINRSQNFSQQHISINSSQQTYLDGNQHFAAQQISISSSQQTYICGTQYFASQQMSVNPSQPTYNNNGNQHFSVNPSQQTYNNDNQHFASQHTSVNPSHQTYNNANQYIAAQHISVNPSQHTYINRNQMPAINSMCNSTDSQTKLQNFGIHQQMQYQYNQINNVFPVQVSQEKQFYSQEANPMFLQELDLRQRQQIVNNRLIISQVQPEFPQAVNNPLLINQSQPVEIQNIQNGDCLKNLLGEGINTYNSSFDIQPVCKPSSFLLSNSAPLLSLNKVDDRGFNKTSSTKKSAHEVIELCSTEEEISDDDSDAEVIYESTNVSDEHDDATMNCNGNEDDRYPVCKTDPKISSRSPDVELQKGELSMEMTAESEQEETSREVMETAMSQNDEVTSEFDKVQEESSEEEKDTRKKESKGEVRSKRKARDDAAVDDTTKKRSKDFDSSIETVITNTHNYIFIVEEKHEESEGSKNLLLNHQSEEDTTLNNESFRYDSCNSRIENKIAQDSKPPDLNNGSFVCNSDDYKIETNVFEDFKPFNLKNGNPVCNSVDHRIENNICQDSEPSDVNNDSVACNSVDYEIQNNLSEDSKPYNLNDDSFVCNSANYKVQNNITQDSEPSDVNNSFECNPAGYEIQNNVSDDSKPYNLNYDSFVCNFAHYKVQNNSSQDSDPSDVNNDSVACNSVDYEIQNNISEDSKPFNLNNDSFACNSADNRIENYISQNSELSEVNNDSFVCNSADYKISQDSEPSDVNNDSFECNSVDYEIQDNISEDSKPYNLNDENFVCNSADYKIQNNSSQDSEPSDVNNDSVACNSVDYEIQNNISEDSKPFNLNHDSFACNSADDRIKNNISEDSESSDLNNGSLVCNSADYKIENNISQDSEPSDINNDSVACNSVDYKIQNNVSEDSKPSNVINDSFECNSADYTMESNIVQDSEPSNYEDSDLVRVQDTECHDVDTVYEADSESSNECAEENKQKNRVYKVRRSCLIDETYEDSYSDADHDYDIMLGKKYQAIIPKRLDNYSDDLSYAKDDRLLWNPNIIPEQDIEDYLSKACSVLPNDNSEEDSPKSKHEEETLYLLLQCGYSTKEALQRIKINRPYSADTMSLWTEEECSNFESGLRKYGKDFHLIQLNNVRTRSTAELVNFYYLWKKTERYDVFVNNNNEEKYIKEHTTENVSTIWKRGGVLNTAYLQNKYPDMNECRRLAKVVRQSVMYVVQWFEYRRSKDGSKVIHSKKQRCTIKDIKILEQAFRKSKYQTGNEYKKLSEKLKRPKKAIQDWFYNRRKLEREKVTESSLKNYNKTKRKTLLLSENKKSAVENSSTDNCVTTVNRCEKLVMKQQSLVNDNADRLQNRKPKKKRVISTRQSCYTKEEKRILESAFWENKYLTGDGYKKLAEELKRPKKSIRAWFYTRRKLEHKKESPLKNFKNAKMKILSLSENKKSAVENSSSCVTAVNRCEKLVRKQQSLVSHNADRLQNKKPKKKRGVLKTAYRRNKYPDMNKCKQLAKAVRQSPAFVLKWFHSRQSMDPSIDSCILTLQEQEILERAFEQNRYPDKITFQKLSQELNLFQFAIHYWFNKRRKET